SEKVTVALPRHRTAPCLWVSGRRWYNNATAVYRPNRQGATRNTVCRHQPRVVSKPRCARSSWKVVSMFQRPVQRVMILVGVGWVGVCVGGAGGEGVNKRPGNGQQPMARFVPVSGVTPPLPPARAAAVPADGEATATTRGDCFRWLGTFGSLDARSALSAIRG